MDHKEMALTPQYREREPQVRIEYWEQLNHILYEYEYSIMDPGHPSGEWAQYYNYVKDIFEKQDVTKARKSASQSKMMHLTPRDMGYIWEFCRMLERRMDTTPDRSLNERLKFEHARGQRAAKAYEISIRAAKLHTMDPCNIPAFYGATPLRWIEQRLLLRNYWNYLYPRGHANHIWQHVWKNFQITLGFKAENFSKIEPIPHDPAHAKIVSVFAHMVMAALEIDPGEFWAELKRLDRADYGQRQEALKYQQWMLKRWAGGQS